MNKQIELKILDDRLLDWGLPAYSRPGDAGMDLRACLDSPLYLEPGETALVPTGIAIHINDENLVGLLFPRSGLASKYGISLSNCVGVVDAGYQNEIKAALVRSGRGKPHVINPGDRICQLAIVPVYRAQWDIVTEFSSESERGLAGWGSSGHG